MKILGIARPDVSCSNTLIAMKKRLHQEDPAQKFTMSDSEKSRRSRFIDTFHKKYNLTYLWHVPMEETAEETENDAYMKWVAFFTMIDHTVQLILYQYDEPILVKEFRGLYAKQLAHNCVLQIIPLRDWIDSPDEIWIGKLPPTQNGTALLTR